MPIDPTLRVPRAHRRPSSAESGRSSSKSSAHSANVQARARPWTGSGGRRPASRAPHRRGSRQPSPSTYLLRRYHAMCRLDEHHDLVDLRAGGVRRAIRRATRSPRAVRTASDRAMAATYADDNSLVNTESIIVDSDRALASLGVGARGWGTQRRGAPDGSAVRRDRRGGTVRRLPYRHVAGPKATGCWGRPVHVPERHRVDPLHPPAWRCRRSPAGDCSTGSAASGLPADPHLLVRLRPVTISGSPQPDSTPCAATAPPARCSTRSSSTPRPRPAPRCARGFTVKEILLETTAGSSASAGTSRRGPT